MASLGHPIVGDKLYGAPAELRYSPPSAKSAKDGTPPGKRESVPAISLPRNFLHATELELVHPRSGNPIALKSPLPPELQAFLAAVEGDVASNVSTG